MDGVLRRADGSHGEGTRFAKTDTATITATVTAPVSAPVFAPVETGFAWLRLIGATLVVVEHCFPLVYPTRIGMFPESWNLSPGYFALMAFFAMSGYQISDSWRRDASWWRYLLKRALRIWPPLLVVVMISAFVIGPLVTVLSQTEYWQDHTTWGYVVNNAGLYTLQHKLPGVFTENPYPWSVNGSIWTLPMETTGYLIVLIAGLVGGLAAGRALLFPVLAAFFVLDAFGQAEVGKPGTFGGYLSVPLAPLVAYMVPFVLGMLFFAYEDRIKYKPMIAYALCAAYLITNFTPPLEPAARFLLPVAAGYGAITWAHHWPSRLAGHDEWVYGSYGMYIWGMPVQQLFVLAGVRSPWVLIACAVPVSYLCGVLSWRLVEKPTQQLRRHLRPPRPQPSHEQQAHEQPSHEQQDHQRAAREYFTGVQRDQARARQEQVVERRPHPHQQVNQRRRYSGDLRDNTHGDTPWTPPRDTPWHGNTASK